MENPREEKVVAIEPDQEDLAKKKKEKKKKKRNPSFRELTPCFPSGTLLEVSDYASDSIFCFIIPNVSLDPKRFLKAKDLKYATTVYLKPGNMVNYLGSYKNIIGKKICIYHRFLYESSIIYVFDESFFNGDIGQFFIILSTGEEEEQEQ